MTSQGSFLSGMIWGISLSIPLWLSLFGWVKWVNQFWGHTSI